jgi:mannosyltransferase
MRKQGQLRRTLLVPGVAVVTTAVLAWGLADPALWLDESASVFATQRHWSDLWQLLRGADAPLVPYYAFLKATASGLHAVLPGGVPPEVIYRLPSVAVSVLAAVVLAAWLARWCSPWLVVAAEAVLVTTGGFSRYGQEARPYAFALAAAVVSTVLWARLAQVAPPSGVRRPAGRREVLAGAAYAAAVLVLGLSHVLALALVPAHLVAAAVTPGALPRRSAVLRTAAGAGAGLLLVAPFVLVAATQGEGPPSEPRPLTPEQLWTVFGQAFTGRQEAFAGTAVLLALAVLGMTRVASPRYAVVARIAASWALVPLLAWLLVVAVHPNLMSHRYLVFLLPAWSVLAGVGVMTVAELLAAAGRRVRGSSRTAGPAGAPVALTAAVVAVFVALLAVLQAGLLGTIRTPSGHGEDLRPALVAARAVDLRSVPIVLSTRAGATEIAPYSRAAERRVIGIRMQRDGTSIWPVLEPREETARLLAEHDTVVLFLQGARTGSCRWRPTRGDQAVAFAERCMPPTFRNLGYEVTSARSAGRRWTFAVLERAPA